MSIWSAVFLLHVVVTYGMTGIMWFVQIVYYPNLAVVGREAFVGYQSEHVRRVTSVAWTFLILELLTGLALVFTPAALMPTWTSVVNAALILAIWASTWFVQVPLHHRLEEGWDGRLHGRLVRTNWFRTIVYTVRGLLVLYVLGVQIAG